MFVFLWILTAMGVGYAARTQGRNPAWWFVLSLVLSPLVGSAALMAVNRLGRARPQR